MENVAEKFQNFAKAMKVFNDKKIIKEDSYRDFTQIFALGSAKLLRYKEFSEDKPTILMISSLINRFYILDISPQKSLVKNLSQENNILIIEWRNPIRSEYEFGLEDYIFQRVIPLIEKVSEICHQNLILLGYCLGGTMSLIASYFLQKKIQGLILIATPWDFEKLNYLSSFGNNIVSDLIFPIYLKLSFWSIDHSQIIKKFEKFSEAKEGSEFYEDFLLIESWLDDGIIVTSRFINDIIKLHYNKLEEFENLYDKLGDKYLEKFDLPKLVIITKNDKIVPNNSSDIIGKMPNSKTKIIDSGHIALFIKKKLMSDLIDSLRQWQKSLIKDHISPNELTL